MWYIYNGILFIHEKKKILHFDNIVGPQGHYAKWNKSDREKNDLTDMRNLKTNKNNKLTEKRTDWWLPELGMGGGGRWIKVQTFGYKINKSWGCNLYHGDHT